ncbi:drug resistance transporter, EmrB/QacA subfamily [Actinomadura madurae]|uniref:Drug resistance transporter, EmrB/QacA subfamily n=1 Tax=Actinomadura madurae TaxID=1993 RepID=A0A1I5JP21_9ACTN|nr:MFS transporter [Actinomadura madurae]SFO74460.1 drug resistance transporter, EmrB/QacA subfamily [Actinomadura madurae]
MTHVLKSPVTAAGGLRLSQPAGRWVVVATSLGAGLVLLETTVLNVALPEIARELGTGMAGMQWTVNAFALALSALILVGGALGDRYGRRRMYLAGLVLFAVASLLGGFAPTVGWLVAARALQGVGAALLVPGSLALIQASFRPGDRARAVGAWSGMSGVAGAAGPLLGGVVVDVAGWRWVFWINIPIAAVVAGLVLRHVPETRDEAVPGRFDAAGAALAAIGLGGLTYSLTDASGGLPVAVAAAAVGMLAMVAFVLVERRASAPMLPLGLFSAREFSAANLASFCLYGAVAGLFFLLPMQLQITSGYSPLATGTALLPITVVVLVLSPRAGTLVTRAGSRVLLTAGSVVCAIGALMAVRVGPDASYVPDVLPVIVATGLGISAITAPISVTVLSAVPDGRAGIASGVNNGVARAAGLLVVAALPLLANLPEDATRNPEALSQGFGVSMFACAALFLLGALVAWWGIGRAPRSR